ncbi:hypothetical protein BUALT_Bualt08G0112200 [Buddleja alternifolia]|uniref:DUF4283 domain-containing protein n=1 Tax=Buddleja alternifolia TaxID=168488 RepID=A0AAV6X4W6_9LAMI|nr:hypothetical protein BUALT_Bualt08G0112200 [Buddleja alternifolia]
MVTLSTAAPIDPVAPPDGEPVSYVDKLKTNTIPPELEARSAKKAFIHGVDSNVIGTSALFNGRMTIFLSKEDDELMAAPFQYALVDKFSHGYPTMQRLHLKFEAMTWYFDGFLMRLLKWSSEFNPNEESPIMPIWIKVFGLRPHWFHPNFLYHIASFIGKPLKLDEATTDIANPMVARMGYSMAACYLRKENNEDDDTEKRNQKVQGHEEDLRKKLNKTRGKDITGDSRGIEEDSSNVVAIHNLPMDIGLERNKLPSESTSATKAQNTVPETIMQETQQNLNVNLTRPDGLRDGIDMRMVDIDGKNTTCLDMIHRLTHVTWRS